MVTLVEGVASVGGGAEKIARNAVTRLDPERFESTFCVTRWADPVATAPAAIEALGLDDLQRAGVRFLGLKREHARQIGAWRPLLSLLRRERVDVVHAHMFGSNLWASIIGTLAGTPVIIAHEHSWSFDGEPGRRFLDRNVIARRAAAVLAVSAEDRRQMIEYVGIDPAKVRVLHNGIPTPAPTSGRGVREELGIPDDVPVIGTVCGLRPVKALDVLLDAAVILVRSVPELRVVIIGDGPDRDRLQRRIADLGLGRTVTLFGDHPEVPRLLRGFDVGVCSSNREGMPLSVLEYMEAKLPVVATNVGGIPEMIGDGVEGLLVAPGDPPALANAVAELLRDPERAAEMGRRGHERRRSEFDVDTMVRRMEDLYEELHEEKRG